MSENPNQDCADLRPEVTVRQNVRRSTRRMRGSPAFGLVPAAIAAGAVLLIGFATKPPLYVARASFSVDWTSVLPAPDNEQAERARNEWRNTIIADVTSEPHSDEEISYILDRTDDRSHDQTDTAAAISKFRRRLHVDLTSQTDDCDRFVIQMRDNDPGLAQAKANGVLQSIVSRLKTASRTGGMAASLRSGAELNQPGLGSSLNLGGASLNNSIKLDQAAQAESRVAGYGLGLLIAALCLGSAAGFAGRLMHQMALAVTALKKTTGGVRQVKTAKRPAAVMLPEISREPGQQPPSLPPPLFPSTAHR